MKQSPIDIVPGNALAESFSKLLFKYKPTPLKIENTGHYVEVPYAPTSYLYVGSQPTDVYQLVQFHFHAPSELTINGVRYDAQLHLVHTNVIGETGNWKNPKLPIERMEKGIAYCHRGQYSFWLMISLSRGEDRPNRNIQLSGNCSPRIAGHP